MYTLDEGIAAYEAEDYNTAFEILMPLAKQGNPNAQTIIAGMYHLGRGISEDLTEAENWYRLASEKGQVIAQNNLATILLNRGSSEAIKWASLAAEKNFPFAQSVLGDIYSGEIDLTGETDQSLRNPSKAVLYYRKAADGGDPIACHKLGDIYAQGSDTNKDEDEAYGWYLKAAECNHGPSQKILGQAYLYGLLGLEIDTKKSTYWLRKAAENGEDIEEIHL